VSGLLLVARAEAALSAQLDVTAELRSQLRAMQEHAEAAEAKVALGLERMRELLNRDLNTGQLWWQDREAIVGVVLALEVGEGTKPVECTARPYECTDGPYGRTHGADCPLSTTTGEVTP
jgi:hypothetical protein